MRIFASIILSLILLGAIAAILGFATTASKSNLEARAGATTIEFADAPKQLNREQQCESLTQQINEELFNNFKEYKRCSSNEECSLFDYSDFKCPLVIRKEKVQDLKSVLDTQLAKSCLQYSVKDGCWVSEFQCKEYRCVATSTLSGRGVPPPLRKQNLPSSSVKDEF